MRWATQATDAQDPGSADGGRAPLKISVVIPLFNGAKFIERSLGSVLLQTRAPDEIVVVDDGSSDDGAAVARNVSDGDGRVRVLHKQNGGQSAARNFGVRNSSGDLIAFLDQDDWWYPRHLEELERPFFRVRSKPLGWSYSDLDEFDGAGGMVEHAMLSRMPVSHPKKTLEDCLRQDMFVLPSASLISRAAFEEANGFDERLRGYEDDDFFVRVFRAGYDNEFIPEPLSAWRIHTDSSSHSPTMLTSGLLYAAKLFEHYPDDLYRSRFYTSDIVAPRFALVAIKAAVQAADRGQRPAYLHAMSALHDIAPRVNLRKRVPLALLRNAMRSYLLVRLGTRLKLHALARRLR